MTIETDIDIQGLQRIGRIVALTIQKMGKAVEPGITTAELDVIGRDMLETHGALSAPKTVVNFPGYTCISINEEAAHGIPGSRKVAKGDIVNIDVSAELGGYFADAARTFLVPPISPEKQKLCDATQRALKNAMNVARAGRPINKIGKVIEQTAKIAGFVTIRDLGSHGVGRALHEEPDFIANYFDASDRRKLKEGQVITIEPFLSTKSQYTQQASDGWTLKTARGNRSVQFEHTMIITKGQPILVTAL